MCALSGKAGEGYKRASFEFRPFTAGSKGLTLKKLAFARWKVSDVLTLIAFWQPWRWAEEFNRSSALLAPLNRLPADIRVAIGRGKAKTGIVGSQV